MGIIKIAIVDAGGAVVREVGGDPHALDPILPALDDHRFQAVRFIDPHGDTVFNVLQWPVVRVELEVLRSSTQALPARRLLDEICALLANAEEQVHVYLKFFGD